MMLKALCSGWDGKEEVSPLDLPVPGGGGGVERDDNALLKEY